MNANILRYIKTEYPEKHQTADRKNIYVNKMKEQEIPHCQNRFQNPIRNGRNKKHIDTPYKHIHDRLLS